MLLDQLQGFLALFKALLFWLECDGLYCGERLLLNKGNSF